MTENIFIKAVQIAITTEILKALIICTVQMYVDCDNVEDAACILEQIHGMEIERSLRKTKSARNELALSDMWK